MYYSKTGNLKRFVEKINKKGINNTEPITPGLIINEPFILIVSTIKFGEVPIQYKEFMRDNSKGIIGVSGSGNRNWGSNFAIAANIISEKFNVPILTKFELSGNEHDVNIFINKIKEIENEYKTHRVK